VDTTKGKVSHLYSRRSNLFFAYLWLLKRDERSPFSGARRSFVSNISIHASELFLCGHDETITQDEATGNE
jgi:hypothetical protein